MSENNGTKHWSTQLNEEKEQKAKRTAEALKNLDKMYEQELTLDDLAELTITSSNRNYNSKFKKRTQADRVEYVKEAKKRVKLLHAAGLLTDCEESVIIFLLDSTVAQQTDVIRTSKQGIAKYIDFDRSTVSKSLKELSNHGVINLGSTSGRKHRPQEIRLNNFEYWFKKSR